MNKYREEAARICMEAFVNFGSPIRFANTHEVTYQAGGDIWLFENTRNHDLADGDTFTEAVYFAEELLGNADKYPPEDVVKAALRCSVHEDSHHHYAPSDAKLMARWIVDHQAPGIDAE